MELEAFGSVFGVTLTVHLFQLYCLLFLLNGYGRCAMGNCYSLQKDHETALKNFQRAVQLNSRFTYAHTLCGHEYDMQLFLLFYSDRARKMNLEVSSRR